MESKFSINVSGKNLRPRYLLPLWSQVRAMWLLIWWPLEAYMVVNFRTRIISRGARKLARTSMLKNFFGINTLINLFFFSFLTEWINLINFDKCFCLLISQLHLVLPPSTLHLDLGKSTFRRPKTPSNC